MANPKHPRRFTEEFKRQIVELYNGGKPPMRSWPSTIIRTKAAAIAANAGRYPISAQCKILGVPRSACCSMRGRGEKPKQPDPLTPEVVPAYGADCRAYGARKIKTALERRGFYASRRRIGRIMRENGLVSACSKAKFKAHADKPNEAELPNIVARGFDGRAPRTHIVSDPACVRVGSKWNYVCLLIDLCNREIVGHAAGERKDARPVKSAFATVAFPLTDIQVFHTDRGSGFDNIAIDDLLGHSESKGPSRGCAARTATRSTSRRTRF